MVEVNVEVSRLLPNMKSVDNHIGLEPKQQITFYNLEKILVQFGSQTVFGHSQSLDVIDNFHKDLIQNCFEIVEQALKEYWLASYQS